MNNKKIKTVKLICMVQLFVLFSCNADRKNDVLQHSWKIKKISFTPSDSILDGLSLKQISTLAMTKNDFEPSFIQITDQSLILRTKNGDSSVLNYKEEESKANMYFLQTEKGVCSITLQSKNEATMSIAGATYYLVKQ